MLWLTYNIRTHTSRKNKELLHMLQVIDLFDSLEAIAMTWIRWNRADSMNDMENSAYHSQPTPRRHYQASTG